MSGAGEGDPALVQRLAQGQLDALLPVAAAAGEEVVNVELISAAINGSTDVTIGYARILAGSVEPRHRHPHGSEWAFVVSGTYLLHLDGRQNEMSPGSSVYIPRDVVHGYAAEEDVEIVWGYSAPSYAELGKVLVD